MYLDVARSVLTLNRRSPLLVGSWGRKPPTNETGVSGWLWSTGGVRAGVVGGPLNAAVGTAPEARAAIATASTVASARLRRGSTPSGWVISALSSCSTQAWAARR